ncbi:hypothetical protein [Acidipila rosea]|uniref:hypothetical protein n=1 Tax=Acidipila rosea TaxID=768535 RepID=UPI0010432EB6|nr:hypothetical protein [Acidipila rosea]MBW4026221.1 hypothetical protein [Acidobacteriota bacterium]MBW4044643.1 hypothetical protein [Acidobacteriota bacterium]
MNIRVAVLAIALGAGCMAAAQSSESHDGYIDFRFQPHTLDLKVAGVHLSGPSTLWQLTGKSLNAVDRVGQAPEVELKQTALGSVSHSLSVAPISVNIYRFPVTSPMQ